MQVKIKNSKRGAAATALSTKFSLQYAVAAALRLGRADPSAFEFDPDVAALARGVDVRVVDDLPTAGHAMPARVTVVDADGRRSREIHFATGHHSEGASVECLRQKAIRFVGAATGFDAFLDLDVVDDCAAIVL